MLKYLYISVIISTLFFYSCENTITPYPPDPLVHITTPITGSVVSGIILIQCESSINLAESYAELCINDSSCGLTDSTAPYIFKLETDQFSDGLILKLSIMIHSGTIIPLQSRPVWVVVDNSRIPGGQIERIFYQNESFLITWSPYENDDFESYTLFESVDDPLADWRSLYYSENRQTTQFVVTNVPVDEYRYYRLITTQKAGAQRVSESVKASSHHKIIYTSKRDGDHDIILMNNDGSFPINLTAESGSQHSPHFSPDARSIIYESEYDIYLMNLFSGEKINLTRHLDHTLDPQFSPDGSQIVFHSIEGAEGFIYIMNVDGSGKIKLTGNVGYESKPKFSPQGNEILYHAYRLPENELDMEIYSIQIDGTNLRRLTIMDGDQSNPAYSPDGSLIVFQSYHDWKVQIYSMNSNGSNIQNLTTSVLAHDDRNPIFSPDGTKIIYESYQEHMIGGYGWHIYEMNRTGGAYKDLINVTSNTNVSPSFSADGSLILFTSDRDGNYEVYCMNNDGSNQINLSQNSAWDSEASFQPRAE